MKAAILSIAILGLLTACGYEPTDRDLSFLMKVKERLKTNGDYVSVAELFPQEWDYVCRTEELASPKQVISRTFNILQSKLIMKDSVDFGGSLSSEEYWGLAFLKKPNTVTAFYIKVSDTNGTSKENCYARSEAILEVQSSELADSNVQHLTLVLKNDSERGEK